MQISVSSTLSVCHDCQFWAGLAEHVKDGRYGVARIAFGAEPSDEEILRFVASEWEDSLSSETSLRRRASLRGNPSAAPERRRRPSGDWRWALSRSRRSRVSGRQ